MKIDTTDITLVELSARDFSEIADETDESRQAIAIIARSIESPASSMEEIASWPKRVVDELLSASMLLNGLDDSGN
ncbi:MAG: hypothetical protein GY895_15470 [Phycisphaera sp.]|nr:hypothetical protein [Phycisphaera sp.]